MKTFALAVISLTALSIVACGGAGREPEKMGAAGQSGGLGDPNPAHAQELYSLPTYPGSVRNREPVSNGNGTFAWYWATASPTLVASFYAEELPNLGWQAVGAPTTVAGPGTAVQTVVSFTKGSLQLAIYLDDNPSKG